MARGAKELRVAHSMCGQLDVVSADGVLAALAARQEGAVARAQLLAAGVTDRQITWRVRAGRLVRIHRGVYAAGHARLRPAGFAWAAVLYAGEGALLSHRSAGAAWGLGGPAGRHEILAPGRRVADTAGVRVRSTTTLAPCDRAERDGLPVTSVARTLADLAAVEPAHRLRRALAEADRRHLLHVPALHEVLDRLGPRAPGRGRLLGLLDEARAHGVQHTRSELEDRFLELVLAAGLPRPATNAAVLGLEVDCWWPRARLAVELDGRAHHARVAAFAADRARDRRLAVAGIRVLRYAWEDVVARADRTRAELSALL